MPIPCSKSFDWNKHNIQVFYKDLKALMKANRIMKNNKTGRTLFAVKSVGDGGSSDVDHVGLNASFDCRVGVSR